MRLTLQPTAGIAEPKKLFAALWGILLKSRICWQISYRMATENSPSNDVKRFNV